MNFNSFLILHIFAGSVALCTFGVPLATKKGSFVHRLFGKIYVESMALVLVSAIGLCTYRLTDPKSTQEERHFAVFLLYLAYLTFSTLWFGLRALVFKRLPARHTVGSIMGSL